MILAYPNGCGTRIVLDSHLEELIGYHLCDLQCGYVNTDDEELCEALELDKRISDAFQTVKAWGWDGEWRVGEEWIGDALAAIVEGSGETDFLP